MSSGCRTVTRTSDIQAGGFHGRSPLATGGGLAEENSAVFGALADGPDVDSCPRG
jgi:hypothetical protein